MKFLYSTSPRVKVFARVSTITRPPRGKIVLSVAMVASSFTRVPSEPAGQRSFGYSVKKTYDSFFSMYWSTVSGCVL